MSHKEQTTHRTTATRNVPSLQDTGTKGVVRKGHAPVSIPRALVARAGPNVKVSSEQNLLLPCPEGVEQAGDKTKLKERKTPSAGTRRTDGRLADSRRRSLWDAVRERGTAFMAQTVNFDSTSSFAMCFHLAGPVARNARAHENTVPLPSVDRIAFREYDARPGGRVAGLVDPRCGVPRMGGGQAHPCRPEVWIHHIEHGNPFELLTAGPKVFNVRT